jgi:hypothetical protein
MMQARFLCAPSMGIDLEVRVLPEVDDTNRS